MEVISRRVIGPSHSFSAPGLRNSQSPNPPSPSGQRQVMPDPRCRLRAAGCWADGARGSGPVLRLPPALLGGIDGMCGPLAGSRALTLAPVGYRLHVTPVSLDKRRLPVVLLQPVVELASLPGERVELALQLADLHLSHGADLRAAVARQPEVAAEPAA